MSKFTTSILQRILFGLILGVALVFGIAATLSFTEPESGPTGFNEPTTATSSGSLVDLIGTPNSTAQGTDTLFDYLRQIDDSPSAYAEPSASSTGYLVSLFGTSTPTTGNGSTLFRYLKRIDDNVAWGTGVNYASQTPQVYDDWNCAPNNEEGTGSCDSDPEFTGEEETWTLENTDNTRADAAHGSELSSGKVYKDPRTGLYWSDYRTTQIDNDFEITNDASCTGSAGNDTCTNSAINSGACNNEDYYCYDDDGDGSALDYCEDLILDPDGGGDESDWYLPSQKELQQAYIDGAANNIPEPDHTFWSSTESYDSSSFAQTVALSSGYTSGSGKSIDRSVRCVRR